MSRQQALGRTTGVGVRRRALGAVRWAARRVRAGRARQASVSGRGAQGARSPGGQAVAPPTGAGVGARRRRACARRLGVLAGQLG